MIIKGFATLCLIIKLDDMFASSLSEELSENAEALSDSNQLVMPTDHNTTRIIVKKFWKEIKANFDP